LLVYAGGLATATMLESDLRGSTVVGAIGVWSAAGLLALGPRRTLAGSRELWTHRQALARVATAGEAEAAYLADHVAAYGIAAVRELCGGPIRSGVLAPPEPSYEPRPVAEPAPAVVRPPHQRPILVPAPAPAVVALLDDSLRTLREFPVLDLPVRRPDRLPVAA
jgi:hypothetical protein